MPGTLAHESGRLLKDLHGALSYVDPAHWDFDRADKAREKIRDVERRLGGLTERPWPERGRALRDGLSDLHGRIVAELPDENHTASTMHARWMAFRLAVMPAYEELQKRLREFEIHVPSLRPTNHTRSIFHVLMGVISIAILWAVPDPYWVFAITGPILVMAWTTEAMRRTRPRMNAAVMRLFAPIAHPHETNRVNSATWYVSALFLLSFLGSPLIAAVAVAVLAVGDPVAALIGRRYGKVRLVHGRTLEGTLAFVIGAGLAAAAVAPLFAPTLGLGPIVAIALSGSVAGAAAELLSLRIDDNLSVSVVAAVAATLMAVALGVPF